MKLNNVDSAERLMTVLSQIIERRRRDAGISQESLARKAGLSRAYLSDVERGLRNISLITLARLADALGTQASTIIAEAEAESESEVSATGGGIVSKNPANGD